MIKLLAKILIINFLVSGWCMRSTAQITEQTVKRIINNLDHLPDDTAKVNALLLAGNFYVNKKGTENADMAAALTYGTRALKLTRKLNDFEGTGKSYTLLSQIHREKGEFARGNDLINTGLSLFGAHPYPAAAAEAYFEAAKYKDIESPASLKTKITLYQKGLQLLELSKTTPLKLADALKFMGDLYQYNGEFQLSLQYLKRALSIYLRVHEKNLQEIYSLLGTVMVKTGNHEEGVRFNLMAVEALEKNNDSTMTACETYCNLANAYNNILDTRHAIKFFQKAKLIAIKNHEIDAAQYILSNIAEDYRSDPKKALQIIQEGLNMGKTKRPETFIELMVEALNAQITLKQYNLAKPYYAYIVKYLNGHSIENDDHLAAYQGLMKYLIATKQYVELKRYETIISLSPHYKPAVLPQLILEHLAFEVDSALGNYFSAMQHSQRYMALNVANLKKRYDQKVASLEVVYATKKKDQDITYQTKHIKLLTIQNELQKQTLIDQHLIRNLIISATSLLTLLLGLSYSRYKIKRNANEELKEKQRAITAQNDALLEQQTAINAQNISLQQLVTEREWLLKEVHHRVKNNLQIIMSLLRTQLSHLKSDDAKDAISVSENRVQAIALIHHKLYNTDNLASVGISDYVADLVNYLSDGLDAKDKKIQFFQSVEMFQVDLAQAVPLGLILNEAITNAIKYGQNENKTEIYISISRLEKAETEMIISDNGKGFPENFDVLTTKSLGMQMMKGLTRQLKGDFDIQSNGGVTVKVKFKLLQILSANRVNKENGSGN